ncbi:hypothetical protein RhiirA5_379904 [Rhizophagus irregularis]|uniref:Uncharacterized protein n=1 Tax=Rhizophagus irregularis TaxID=588596 RepID=A0A2N0PAC9_9GLOM|nr:hypothetical protein RhiirA5_379904 [Rhizophagus irregularis]
MEGDLEREAESSHSLVGFKEKSTRVQEKSPLSQDTIQERLPLYEVPTAIFIGWAVLCFAGIIALAGVGITIAEGFFLFLGMSVFLPVAIILCIIAFVTVVFLTLAWIGMRSSVTVYGYFNGPSNVEVEEAEYTKRSIDEKNKFDL